MSKDSTFPTSDDGTDAVAHVTDTPGPSAGGTDATGRAAHPAGGAERSADAAGGTEAASDDAASDVPASADAAFDAADSHLAASDAPASHLAAVDGVAVGDAGDGDAAGAADVAADADAGDDGASGADSAGAGPLETPVLSDVLLAVEELWPESLAEDWDRVGLVVGRPEAEVDRIMFAVDPTLEVIDEALEWGAQLLITHHPLLLKGVNSVAATTAKGRAVHRLIEGGCALLTVHTNGDSAVGGVSDVLADILELDDVQPLMPAARGLVEEGIGRVGYLPAPEKLGNLAAKVFLTLPAVAGGVRVAGDKDALVRKVAVCGGAGDSLFDAVRASDADVFVTADLRHHPASEAREARLDGRPYLIDLSHFASEWLWLPNAMEALGNVLADQGFAAELALSQTNTDPWDFILTPGLISGN